jgi:pimeloyl-ACP methyl ester carboxylesterase
MRRAIYAGAIIASIIAAVVGFYIARNPERGALDDAARQEAPGKFIRLTDGVTHYRIDGPDTGRVVVLAHGFSVPLYIWDSTAKHLSDAGYRVVRYDYFGRGWSDRPDVAYNDKLYERQLGELLDSLRLTGKVDLAGVSFGGYVTGLYAGRHPDRVRTLTLVDPVAGDTPTSMPPLDYPLIGGFLFQTMGVPGMAAGQATDFIDASRFPDWADRYRVQQRYRGFGRALRSTQLERRGLNTDTLYGRVATTGIPVLLIWGEKDETVPFERHVRVQKAIPNVIFRPIAGSAHLPILEQAAGTDSIIMAFLVCHPERSEGSAPGKVQIPRGVYAEKVQIPRGVYPEKVQIPRCARDDSRGARDDSLVATQRD